MITLKLLTLSRVRDLVIVTFALMRVEYTPACVDNACGLIARDCSPFHIWMLCTSGC